MDPIVLFSFSEVFSDMGFIIKLFLLVAILGFLNQHIENKILKVVVALFMGYVMLIVNWSTFGTLYVIYAVLGMGISSMFVDYFFMSQGSGHEAQQEAHNNLAAARKHAGMGGLPENFGLEGQEMQQELPQANPSMAGHTQNRGFFGRLFGGR